VGCVVDWVWHVQSEDDPRKDRSENVGKSNVELRSYLQVRLVWDFSLTDFPPSSGVVLAFFSASPPPTLSFPRLLNTPKVHLGIRSSDWVGSGTPRLDQDHVPIVVCGTDHRVIDTCDWGKVSVSKLASEKTFPWFDHHHFMDQHRRMSIICTRSRVQILWVGRVNRYLIQLIWYNWVWKVNCSTILVFWEDSLLTFQGHQHFIIWRDRTRWDGARTDSPGHLKSSWQRSIKRTQTHTVTHPPTYTTYSLTHPYIYTLSLVSHTPIH